MYLISLLYIQTQPLISLLIRRGSLNKEKGTDQKMSRTQELIMVAMLAVLLFSEGINN